MGLACGKTNSSDKISKGFRGETINTSNPIVTTGANSREPQEVVVKAAEAVKDELQVQLDEFIDPSKEMRDQIDSHKINQYTKREGQRFSRLIRCMNGENFRYYGEMSGGMRNGYGLMYLINERVLFVGEYANNLKNGQFQVYTTTGYEELTYNSDVVV